MKEILVVVDIQNDFVDGALGSEQAIAIVGRAAQKIKNHNGLIFVTYDTHFDDYLETSEGRKLPVPHCIKGTSGWNLNSRIASALSDKRYIPVEKNTFGSVELPKLIKKECEDEEVQIELIGLCTDICVVSNALILKAYFPNCTISVDSSCCAGVTPQSHQAAVDTMKACQIEVS